MSISPLPTFTTVGTDDEEAVAAVDLQGRLVLRYGERHAARDVGAADDLDVVPGIGARCFMDAADLSADRDVLPPAR
jgi:hypothetical protein